MIRKLLFFLLLSYIPATAQQSFIWLQNRQVNYSFNPGIPKTMACKGLNSEVWFAYYDSVYASWSLDPLGNITISRMDVSGNTLQSFQLGPRATIHDMIVNQSGDLIITGAFIDTLWINQTDSLMNSFPALNLDPFLICIDVNGQVKWKHNLGAGMASSFILPSLRMSPSGEIYYSYTDFSSGYIVHIDSTGSPLGQIIVDGIRTIGDFGFTPSGGLFIAGATGNGSVFSIGSLSATVTEPYMLYIAYTNPMGNGQWVQFAHDVTFQAPRLATDGYGNAYVASMLMDSLTWGNFHLDGPDWVYDFFLVKVDSNGVFHWAKEGPNPTGGIVGDFEPAGIRSLDCDQDGNVMLCGTQRGTINWGNGFVASTSQISVGNLTAVLFDSAGTTRSLKMAMGSIPKNTHSIYHDAGGWYITGTSTTESGVLFDTLQVDFLYNQNAFITRIADTPVGISEPVTSTSTIYPNPGTGIYQLPAHWIDRQPVVVTDLSGRRVYDEIPSGSTIDLRRLSAGMYVIRHGTDGVSLIKE